MNKGDPVQCAICGAKSTWGAREWTKNWCGVWVKSLNKLLQACSPECALKIKNKYDRDQLDLLTYEYR